MGFIQDEVLRMTWLSCLLRLALEKLGLNVDSRIGGSLHFFLYDCVKITILLCVLIFVVSQQFILALAFVPGLVRAVYLPTKKLSVMQVGLTEFAITAVLFILLLIATL